MDEIELAYIAGFFDGEGWVGLVCQKPSPSRRNKSLRYYLQTGISNTNLSILQYLKNNFGGIVVQKKKQRSNHKTSYLWSLGTKNSYNFLQLIYPYIKMKRERIELAIECQSRIGKHGGPIRLSEEELSIRKNYYLKLRELNKKGI